MAQEAVPERCFSYLLSLSDEVLVMIFSSLRTEDLISLSKVSRRFDMLLMDHRLCRDVSVSPASDVSNFDNIGLYFRKRRQLIRSLNISSCHWIPLTKVTLMTKNLPNLVSLNVMNITLSVKHLTKIFKESKQLKELSWSWSFDGKFIPWSEVPCDERVVLAGLEKLHICLPHPWCLAARELYGFCHGLTHLTVEVNPFCLQLPTPKVTIGKNLLGPTKLKSLIAWRNSRVNDVSYNHMVDVSIGQMLRHFWDNCGRFHGAWECLWTNAYDQIPWRTEMTSSQFSIIPTNLTSIVIHSVDFVNICNELPVSHLVIIIPLDDVGAKFPPLIAVAPKLQKLGVIANGFSLELNFWINAALGSSEHLVEINLFGVHYCRDHDSIEKLWLALKSLKKLKKLAIAPCVLPRIESGGNSQHSDGKKFIVSHAETSVVEKKIAELLSLKSLENFEVGYPSNNSHITSSDVICCYRGTWVPYIAAISLWSKLLYLTIDSIFSLRSLHQLKLVTLGCKSLKSLRIRNLGTKGYCGYVKDIAVTLSSCQALRHFRLDQPYIFDQIKDLLTSLSQCINLETIVITNYDVVCSRHFMKKEDFKRILLNVANSCPYLTLMLVTLPDVTAPICNRIRSEIMKRVSQPRKSSLVMEFCSYPFIGRSTAGTYHKFLEFPYSSLHCDELNMLSKVAISPPLKHIS